MTDPPTTPGSHDNGRGLGGPSIATIGSWEATDVTAGQVEAALSSLRRHEQRAAVRASVLTLVVVVESREEADAALASLHDLGTRHPSRTIVAVVGKHKARAPEGSALSISKGRSGRDASVKVHAVDGRGRVVCFEDLVLTIRGQGRHHLDSVVEPFTLPDVPMVVWLPARLPALGDPLMAAANRVVVDSRATAEVGGDVLASSAVLTRRMPVVDLSWIRLTPWRHLLAGLFEGGLYRPFLRGIDRVTVSGNFGPRHLVGGWLLRRLAIPASVVHLESAPHVSVALNASHDGRQATFTVARTGAERVIRTCVDIEGGPRVEQVVHMRSHWPALALAGALTQTGHDAVYEQALAGARELRA